MATAYLEKGDEMTGPAGKFRTLGNRMGETAADLKITTYQVHSPIVDVRENSVLPGPAVSRNR